MGAATKRGEGVAEDGVGQANDFSCNIFKLDTVLSCLFLWWRLRGQGQV